MQNNPLTAFGEVLVGQLTPMAAWRFDYGLNTRLVETTTANGGTVTVDGNRVKLSTSAAINGSARVETVKHLRYYPGMGGLLRMTSIFSTPKANSTQLFGIGDGTDGLYYGYYGTDFVVGKIRGGTHTRVLQSAWNGSMNPNFNSAFGNIFQIRFQWLGYGYLRYYMLNFEDETAGYVKLHTINYPNTSADVHILNPTLPIFGEVANTGNNTNIVAYSPSAAAFVEGEIYNQANPMDVYNAFDVSATYTTTNRNHLLTIRNKSTFLTLTNRVPVQIKSITFSRGAGSAITTLRLVKSATTAGALTYADIDTNNSPVDASITTTTVTGGTIERSYSTPAGALPTIVFEPGDMVLYPGETLTLECLNSLSQTIDVVATVNWAELF